MQLVPVDRTEPKHGMDALLEGWASFRDGWLLLDMAVVLLLALLLGAVIAYHPSTRRRVSSLEHFEQPKTLLMYAVVAAIGATIGVVVAYLCGRLVSSWLYEVQASDPMILGAATMVVSGIALVATMIPAARAARINPSRVLRPD